MAKRVKSRPRPGAPAWMVTYGDMMTLLLTFFVLIVSFSQTEIIRFRAAISSIREGLGIWPESTGMLPSLMLENMPRQRTAPKQQQQVEEMIREVSRILKEQDLVESVEIYNIPSGVRMIISDRTMFNSGEAILLPRFEKVMLTIAKQIQKLRYTEIRVEGHTDNVPIHTSRYPSNWELSSARALSATKFLVFQGGLPPEKLSAVGYGENRPRASNDTPEGRALNRRVEIFVEFRSEENR